MKKSKLETVVIEKYSNALVAELKAPTGFTLGSVETAVPDRAIPLSELFARFVRGENIIDGRFGKSTYNPIENNPWKKKGLDLADTPEIARNTRAMKQQAEQQAAEEAVASKQAKEKPQAQEVQQSQDEKPAAE